MKQTIKQKRQAQKRELYRTKREKLQIPRTIPVEPDKPFTFRFFVTVYCRKFGVDRSEAETVFRQLLESGQILGNGPVGLNSGNAVDSYVTKIQLYK